MLFDRLLVTSQSSTFFHARSISGGRADSGSLPRLATLRNATGTRPSGFDPCATST